MQRKIWSLGFLVPVLLVGCELSPARKCTADADCAGEARCDLVLGACVEPETEIDAGPPVCEPACGAYEECTLGGCMPRYQAVQIDRPTANAVVGAAGAQVTAKLVLEQGRTPNAPGALWLETQTQSGSPMDGGVSLAHQGDGSYVGTWPSPGEGTFRLQAHSAELGLKSFSVPIVVDLSPPEFTVSVPDATRSSPDAGTSYVDPEAGFGTAYRKDEQVVATVETSEPNLDFSTVQVSVVGVASGGGTGAVSAPVKVTQWTHTGSTWTGQLAIELASVELQAFRGTFTVRVDGTDLAGNVAATATTPVKVTRWKWVHDAAPGTIKATPAIGQKGTNYFGTIEGSAGLIRALKPDGTVLWSSPSGSVEASPAVLPAGNDDAVYVAANTTSEVELHRFDGTTGSDSVICTEAGSTSVAAPAVGSTQLSAETAPIETAFFPLTQSSSGSLLAVRHTSSSSTKCLGQANAGNSPFPAAAALHNGDVFFGDDLGNVQGFTFNATGWTAKTGWPAGVNLFSRALAVVGAKIGGGGGPGKGGVFTIPLTGVQPDWSFPSSSSSSSPAWNPSVGPTSLFAYGNSASELTLVATSASTATATASSDGSVHAAPLWGQGGLLYTSSANGALEVWNSSLEPQWALSGLGAFEASPNIDCARDSTGAKLPGRPGVLYLASTNGKLYAFVVDSRGIDTSAPWPRHQHDPRNSGNSSTPLSDFSCP